MTDSINSVSSPEFVIEERRLTDMERKFVKQYREKFGTISTILNDPESAHLFLTPEEKLLQKGPQDDRIFLGYTTTPISLILFPREMAAVNRKRAEMGTVECFNGKGAFLCFDPPLGKANRYLGGAEGIAGAALIRLGTVDPNTGCSLSPELNTLVIKGSNYRSDATDVVILGKLGYVLNPEKFINTQTERLESHVLFKEENLRRHVSDVEMKEKYPEQWQKESEQRQQEIVELQTERDLFKQWYSRTKKTI